MTATFPARSLLNSVPRLRENRLRRAHGENNWAGSFFAFFQQHLTRRASCSEAWTKPELLKRWWAPKSTGVSLLAFPARGGCSIVRGRYRFEFQGLKAYGVLRGRYIEVTPHSRLAWTNDESDDGARYHGDTFEEKDGKTLLVMHQLYYPSKGMLSTVPSPGWRVECPRRSRNWTSFSSPWRRDAYKEVITVWYITHRPFSKDRLHNATDLGKVENLRGLPLIAGRV